MKPVPAAVVAAALFALLPSAAAACSLIQSPRFELQADARAASPAPRLIVRAVELVPWVSSAGTCDGVGFIKIEVAGLRARGVGKYGVYIRPRSGVNDPKLFGDAPLAPIEIGRSGAAIWVAWTGITPDADGKVRWTLELVPVSRSGVRGAPVTICAASDGSCPSAVIDAGGG